MDGGRDGQPAGMWEGMRPKEKKQTLSITPPFVRYRPSSGVEVRFTVQPARNLGAERAV